MNAVRWCRWATCITELASRHEALADGDDRVWFLDTSATMDYAAHPTYFGSDEVHPSVTGAESVGADLSAFIGGR